MAPDAFTQKKDFGGKNWDFYRHEFELGIGVSNYLGELGGKETKSKFLSPKDIEYRTFKLAYDFAYRYNFGSWFAIRPSLFFGKVAGNDQFTTNSDRNYRNLQFHSRITELAVVGELHIIRAQRGHSFYHAGVIGTPGFPFGVSLHMGIGYFWFNPKRGNVNLRDLSTEGQGLPGGPVAYKKTAISAPVGMTICYQINKEFRLGATLSARYTNTDYLDDASTVYYDKEALRTAKGDLAAELSDKSDQSDPGKTSTGAARGNPKNNDFYYSAMLYLTYTPSIISTGSGR